MENTTARDPFGDSVPGFGDRVEAARRDLARATAAVWTLISETLEKARRAPWEWIPCTVGDTSPAKREHAERAAALDLGARLRMSEASVRTTGALADRCARRLPSLWAAFAADGTVSAGHLRALAEVSEHLDDTQALVFDLQVLPLAQDLPPGRTRARARLLAERLHRRPLDQRHSDATLGRRVTVEPAEDGMAWLTAFLPADVAHQAKARLDAQARGLADIDGETRTRDQLRADVLGDLLTGHGTPGAVKTVVHLDVPVLTLLGEGTRPILLDGVVPVPPAVARRLCGETSVLYRVLTDPITSAVIDLDRRSYRPTADLARFVRLRDKVCVVSGCSRPAAVCDLDHSTAWSRGGCTSAKNLGDLCPSHHKVKHETLWAVAGTHGHLTWTSPTGYLLGPEPPDPPDPPPRVLDPAA